MCNFEQARAFQKLAEIRALARVAFYLALEEGRTFCVLAV